MFCSFLNPPVIHKRKTKVFCMERNQPRWFLWSRLWSFMAPQLYRALEGRAWTCLRSSNNCGADHNFISILNMLWTHIHRVTELITFPKRGTFTLHWPHLNKHSPPSSPRITFTACLPHPIQTPLGESTTSSPPSIRCLSILVQVSMSLQTQRG